MSYEHTSTVASKLFNFAATPSNLNVSDYLSDPQTFQCCYESHGHVRSPLIRVMENAKLRKLVAKGPLESIDLYARNWSKR